MNEFFTWEVLATFAGASVATAVITQFIKKSIDEIPTQIVSYVVALIVMLVATVATGTDGWRDLAIVPLNAVIVSVAANGEFGVVNRIKGDKSKPE